MKDYDYYTVAEILHALKTNTDDVRTRSIIAAKYWIKKYDLAVESNEVFHDAIVRILANDRHIPKGIPLGSSMGKMIQSICHGIIKLNKEKIFKHSEPIDDYDDSNTAQSSETYSYPDSRWDELMTIFIEDGDATAFLTATRGGQSKSEIVSSVFGGNNKAYDTTRRRIIRNGQKYLLEVK